MKLKFKSVLSILLAFALVFGVYQPIVHANDLKETITVIGSGNSGTLVTETEFTYQENMTAFDALVNTVGQDQVEFTQYSFGKMITSIMGVGGDQDSYWTFYINGIQAQVGADSYRVQDGDELSFNYVNSKVASTSEAILEVSNKEVGDVYNQALAFINEPTALDLLIVALGHENVLTTKYPFGVMIDSINGISATSSNYWMLYINGKSADVGADGYKIKNGDTISFKYESSGDPTEGEETPTTGDVKPVSTEEIKKSIDNVTTYIATNNIGEWEAVSLKQAGKTIPASYLENIKKVIKEKQGKFSKVTDTERYVLGILAAGGNPLNIEGYNLVEAIYNGNLTKQGLNGVTYGLIALDSANFEVPQSATWTREKLVNHLLTNQNSDGGWSWDGGSTSDLDTTGMVLAALAPYKNQSHVKQPIENGVNYLSTQYKAGKVDNSSTAAQLVIALSALGIDSAGASFTKDQAAANTVTAQATSTAENLISYLVSFQNSDGGFDWQGGDTSDSFSTAQAVQGLVSYQLFLQGKGSLYQLPLLDQAPQTPIEETPIKQPNSNEAGGKLLPNTATNTSNLIVIGMLLLCIGIVKQIVDRRKKA
ncbi:DUF4430 domain-containing protein [Bacillus suaedaesalsae]|uniref:DUF4430 domain-containing protein n=1 Tax=Bacillus suaedaesalsae TaxID=2810349 RepID=A0ABS2DQ49_9BACI|nr:DUF4430 domain-containing protein [Bacillus suaedaesalsae]MBM6619916.1 DUF4430 domain-containing protein [Bacillus suaedaesalsae]